MFSSFRIAAYGEARDEAGRLLLTRATRKDGSVGPWHLPGGVLEHGEAPFDAVVRQFNRDTGFTVAAETPLQAVSTVRRDVHTNAIIYRVRLLDEPNADNASDPKGGRARRNCQWVTPEQASAEDHSPFVAAVLGTKDLRLADVAQPKAPQQPRPTPPTKARKGRRKRGQRFGAYGLVTDPTGEMFLLARIATGYPGAGGWHLPGGGVDFSEQPRRAVAREIFEETGQHAIIGQLLDVTSFRHRRAIGPEGYPLDWHGVRAIYQATVSEPSTAQVVEAAGGSTSDSRWFTRGELDRQELTAAVVDALKVVDAKKAADSAPHTSQEQEVKSDQ
ncbi:NUDIX hydrolase [Natronoglycomyces albus]|uniref:NUDIX domain-containing protein n=1 Tax=Natronoglycomyces albus TaxID=2811108 RepID=A0A895XMI8_9ACTN|nr:NUDIX domain-containing protein [Natronoglycomyces albus]QSB04753.1 NUDIX domain-containing protein [Natronoglycomyces albus]